MLREIMMRYFIYRNLEEFQAALDLLLRGPSGSEPNKIYLKKMANKYFYGREYQVIVEGINQLKESGHER